MKAPTNHHPAERSPHPRRQSKSLRSLSEQLATLRQRIDRLDTKLLANLEQRLKCAAAIGKLKHQHQEKIYHPEREKAVLERMCRARGEFPEKALKNIYLEIISACRSYEEPLKIAYLGQPGSFSHQAALRQFGSSSQFIPCPTIKAVFEVTLATNESRAPLGIVPIENSSEGVVNHTMDLLASLPVFVYFEIYLSIHLCLLAPKKEQLGRLPLPKALARIKTVYSHPQPFAQARQWLEKKLPHATLKESASTSQAALLCTQKKSAACLAAKAMLRLSPELNLEALQENIEDRPHNTTRFVVLSREKNQLPQALKEESLTSIIISIKDKPGALQEILELLSKANLNLTNILSRPSHKKAFDYFFFIDFIGHHQVPAVRQALKEIEAVVVQLKVLGSYPRGMQLE